MRKLRLTPERVSGVVALTYLVLIPAGAYYAWRKIESLDKDLTTVWEKLNLEVHETPPAMTRVQEQFQNLTRGLRR